MTTGLLFDAPRLHVSGAGPAVGAKRRRFGPLRDGMLALVRVGMELEEIDGETWPKVAEGQRARWISIKLTIAVGQQKGRWFYDRLMISGHLESVERANDTWRAMMSCYERTLPPGEPTIPNFAQLHDRVFPIMVTQGRHWKTGQTVNSFQPLSADPWHGDYDLYHQLVKRQGKEVPGWDLHPASAACELVQRRDRDASEVREDGMTMVERRRQKSVDRFYERFGASSEGLAR